MPSLVKRRACPAPVGRSWTWPGELRSVVATHFPFGDKTPYPAPSPSRIAGDPSVPRLKVPYFPPVASPVSEKITVRPSGEKSELVDQSNQERFLSLLSPGGIAMMPACALSSVSSTRPSRVMSCTDSVAGTRITSRSFPPHAERVNGACSPAGGGGEPYFFSVARPGDALHRGAETGSCLAVTITICDDDAAIVACRYVVGESQQITAAGEAHVTYPSLRSVNDSASRKLEPIFEKYATRVDHCKI